MKDKKYTVKDFYEKYNAMKNEDAKRVLIQSVMNIHYVNYVMKITICEKITEASYYIKETINGMDVKKLHINTPAQYMLYCLWLVQQYTYIKVNFKDSLTEFDLLNKNGILDTIVSLIPEKEIKEFRMILDMTANDVLQNEYEPQAFITNQIERFAKIAGMTMKPFTDQFNKLLKDINQESFLNLLKIK